MMRKLHTSEIDTLEDELGRRLPPFVRRLLITVGHGELPTGCEFYHPGETRGLFENHFERPSLLFQKYWPLGCDNEWQELWILDVVANRVASICHETHEGDWEDEDWLEPETWLATNRLMNSMQ